MPCFHLPCLATGDSLRPGSRNREEAPGPSKEIPRDNPQIQGKTHIEIPSPNNPNIRNSVPEYVTYIQASSPESVGKLSLGQLAELMVEHGFCHVKTAVAVGFLHRQFHLVIHPLHAATR